MENNKLLNKRWRNVTLILIAFLILVIVQDIVREVLVFNQEKELIISELSRDIQNEVQTNVEQLSEDFYLIIDNLTTGIVIHTKENLEGLVFAANSFVEMNPLYTDEEIKDGIATLTDTFTTLDGLHNYSLYDTSGNQYYDGDTNSFVTTDVLEQTDYLNNRYMEELMNDVANNGVAAVNYYKIFEDELTHFIIYGELIENTSLIVTNEVNMNTFSEEQKNIILFEMIDKFDNSNDYFFVLANDGTVLYHHNQEYIGYDADTIEDETVSQTITLLTEYASTKSSGHIYYDFYRNDSTIEKIEKIAFIQRVDEWNIVLGSALETDKYADIIENYTTENSNLVIMVKTPSYILVILFALILYLYLKSTIKLSQQLVEKEEILYRKFAELTEEIIFITDKQGEIIFGNNLGNEIVFGQREDRTNVFFDQILVEEEGYYILYGYSEDYLVKYITEPINYNNIDADLYIISDVTEKIKTERKLEALSLVDELTKLGNRRAMVRDYNENILLQVKNGNDAYLAMLDLDDFKPANDLYGHSYGDEVLKNVAFVFESMKDKNTFVYRVGGDEFALMFVNKSNQEVTEQLEEMQSKVENFLYDKPIALSFSAGVTDIKVNDTQRRFSDYYDKADKLLYKSKKQGKHRISFK